MPLDRVRAVEVEVDVTAAPDLPAALGHLEQALLELSRRQGGRGLLVRARLTGRPAWYGDLSRLAPEEPADVLRQRLQGRDPFIWVEAVEWALVPPLDETALRQRADLLRRHPEAREELWRALWAELKLGAIPLPPQEQEELLRWAEERCLALLMGGEEG